MFLKALTPPLKTDAAKYCKPHTNNLNKCNAYLHHLSLSATTPFSHTLLTIGPRMHTFQAPPPGKYSLTVSNILPLQPLSNLFWNASLQARHLSKVLSVTPIRWLFACLCVCVFGGGGSGQRDRLSAWFFLCNKMYFQSVVDLISYFYCKCFMLTPEAQISIHYYYYPCLL